MLDQIIKFFLSGFVFPNLSFPGILLGIFLGLLFGAIWLAPYLPPMFKKPYLWAVLAGSAFLTWIAISFIQLPLQYLAGQILGIFWTSQTLQQWALVASLPSILISGLVQEAAKLVPVLVWWFRKDKDITPQIGLILGAVAGAGFGIFESVWIHNTVFNAGWSLQAVSSSGVLALVPFWERFFSVAFHTSVTALAGFGLAKGLGWKFYLLAALAHAVTNYLAVIYQYKLLSILQVELSLTIIAVIISGIMIWIRWRRTNEQKQ